MRTSLSDAAVAAMLATGAALLWSAPASAIGVPGQGSWQATLQPRYFALNNVIDNIVDAFYDTDLDVTWYASANQTVSGWDSARSVAAAWNMGGFTGWRLPTMVDLEPIGCPIETRTGGTDCGYNVQSGTSEMAHLFYVTLGNKSVLAPGTENIQPGWGLTNTGDFKNLQDWNYWTGVEDALYPATKAWRFDFSTGRQVPGNKATGGYYLLAVRDGDVAAVPEPTVYALMFAGLAVIAMRVRRLRVLGVRSDCPAR